MAKISNLGYQLFHFLNQWQSLYLADQAAFTGISIFPCFKSIQSLTKPASWLAPHNCSSVCLALPQYLAWFLAYTKKLNICSIMCTQNINLWLFPEVIFRLFLVSPSPEYRQCEYFAKFPSLLKECSEKPFNKPPWC